MGSKSFNLCLGFVLLIGVSAGIGLASPTPVDTGFRPKWQKQNRTDHRSVPNQSYLQELITNKNLLESPFTASIFDTSYSSQKRVEFENLIRDFERLEHYGLVTSEDEKAHVERLHAFSETAAKETGRYHAQKKLTSLRVGLENSFKEDPALKGIRKPVEVVTAVAAFSLGVPFKMKVSDSTEIVARSEVIHKKGGLKMTSPVFDTAFDFTGTAASQKDPFQSGDERYRVSVSRGLPVLDVQTGFSYGTSSSKVTASLSKQLHPGLTCILDSSRVLKEGITQPRNEETIKLLYGLHF